jgi:hypothetical protein
VQEALIPACCRGHYPAVIHFLSDPDMHEAPGTELDVFNLRRKVTGTSIYIPD